MANLTNKFTNLEIQDDTAAKKVDNLSDLASPSTAFANIKQAATDAVTGVVELATPTEAAAGSDTTRAITAADLLIGGTLPAGATCGTLKALRTTSISGYYAPNALGEGSVDLQLYRVSATDIASGQFSLVAGKRNSSVGNYNLVVGTLNSSAGNYNLVAGSDSGSSGAYNLVTGYTCSSGGVWNLVSGSFCASTGNCNLVSGSGCSSVGGRNLVSGSGCSSAGSYNSVSGDNCSSVGSRNSVSGNSCSSAGNYNLVNGYDGSSIGSYNSVSGYDCSSIGSYNSVSGYGSNPGLNITAITKAAAAVISTSSPHKLATGSKVTITGVSGMTQINNLASVVTYISPTTFSVPVNSTLFSTYTSGGLVNPAGDKNLVTGMWCRAAGDTNAVSGNESSASGNSNLVSGQSCSSSGNYNILGGNSNTATGEGNILSGYDCHSPGNYNSVSGAGCSAAGNRNLVSGHNCTCAGSYNSVSGDWCSSVGNHNSVSGYYGGASGQYNLVSGYHSSSTGNYNAVSGGSCAVSGNYNRVSGSNCWANGTYNSVSGYYASSAGSSNLVAGRWCTGSGYGNLVIGNSCSAAGSYNATSGSTCTSFGNNNLVTGDSNNAIAWTITGITKAAAAVITTSIPHSLLTGAKVWISGVGGMTQINGLEIRTATYISPTTFSVPVNSVGFSTYTSGGSVYVAGSYSMVVGRNGHSAADGAHVFTDATSDEFVAAVANTFNIKAANGLRLEPIATASAPASPIEGTIYFDSSLHALRQHNGTTWDCIGGASPSLVQGRLTLTSATPVLSASVVNSGSIYFTPYRGNRISLYSSSAWVEVSFTEQTITLSALTASTYYDVFAYLNAGALALETVAWTNVTTRATALTTQDGVYAKTGDTTRKYLGTFFCDSGKKCSIRFSNQDAAITDTSLTGGVVTGAHAGIYNYYNKVTRGFTIYEDTDNWVYTSATWRLVNGTARNAVSLVCGGIQEDSLSATANSISSAAAAARRHSSIAATYLNGLAAATYVSPQHQTGAVTPSTISSAISSVSGLPSTAASILLEWYESGNGTQVTTWYGHGGASLIRASMRVDFSL